MSPENKPKKLYPGHYRIVRALIEAPMTFTKLAKEADLSRVALSKYLKDLRQLNFVAYDEEKRLYYLPTTLQPLHPESYPRAGRDMQTIVEDIWFYGDLMASLKDPFQRQAALTEFLHIQFPLLAGNLVMVINEACGYEDPSEADEFIQRSLETYFVPWIHLLGMVCFRNKEFSEKPLDQTAEIFMKIAEATYERFLQRLPKGEEKTETSGSKPSEGEV